MSLYIKNARFIDWQSFEITRTHICVEPGKTGGIKLIDDLPESIAEGSKVVDAQGRWVTKSFACGHHHIYSTLARGMPAPAKAPVNFVEILKYIWWNLDKNLDFEMIKASALASAVYCAKNGVTFVIDHHASPFAVENSLFAIKEAFDSIGLSHLLCYEISDRDGKAVREAGLAETKNYLTAGNPGHVGLHASFTVGDELLGKAVQLARDCDTGLHMHVAEDKADQADCEKKYGKRVVQRLADAGALELKGSILGHCLHLDEDEINRIKNSSAWVVQNVESNLNNNVGLTDYSAYGDRIMLGTDGMHSDMLRSAKASFLLGQQTEQISFPGIYDRFRKVHTYIEENGFQGDTDNNLVILDYNPPTDVTRDNFLGHFVYGLDSAHVSTVISGGQVIVEERKLVSANETDIMEFAREMGNRLWRKLV